MFLVLGQALLQVLGEGVGTDVAQHIDMAVVTVLQALKRAVLLRLVEKLVDLIEQAVVFAGGHRPALVSGVAQVEGHAHIGEVDLVHGQLVGVDQGQVDLAFVDHAQQVDHFDGVGLFVFQPRILFFSSASWSAWLLPLSTMIFLPTSPLALVGRERPLR